MHLFKLHIFEKVINDKAGLVSLGGSECLKTCRMHHEYHIIIDNNSDTVGNNSCQFKTQNVNEVHIPTHLTFDGSPHTKIAWYMDCKLANEVNFWIFVDFLSPFL